jgi:hypothetical protein
MCVEIIFRIHRFCGAVHFFASLLQILSARCLQMMVPDPAMGILLKARALAVIHLHRSYAFS